MSRYTIPPSLSKEKVYGPFFFMEKTITGIVYLDMLEEFHVTSNHNYPG
jgi:hypothetical protein